MKVLQVFSILSLVTWTSGLLHPATQGPTLEQLFANLEMEIRQNISNLQQQVFASETLALRQILNQERDFRKELEQEVNELKSNQTDVQKTLSQEIHNVTQNLGSLETMLDNVIREQEKICITLGNIVSNETSLMTSMSQNYQHLSTVLTDAQQEITSMKSTMQHLSHSSSQGNVIAFTAVSSSGKDYGSEKIVFNRIITNVGSAYSSTSGVFTSPSEGVYMFTWTHLIYSGHYCHAYLYRNGNRISLDAHSNLSNLSGTVYTMSTMSGSLSLSKGDQVWIQASHCPSFNGAPYNSFSGWKL